MIFPDGGRIVIIDDKEDEGLPLLNALIKEGHLATFFREWKESLPKNPLNGIRIVFLDLILGNEYQDDKTVVSTVLNVLNKILNKEENGPFILIAWTNRPGQADMIKGKLHDNGFKFLMTVMEKKDCKTKDGEFSVRKIQMRLRESLKGNDALQLFVLWENLIHRAAGKIVNEFSSLANMDDRWNENMEGVIATLAECVLGEHFDPSKVKEVIDNAMYSMNSALVDAVRQETKYSSKTSKIDLKIPLISKKRVLTLAEGTINSKLLLKKAIDNSPVPGNIYSNNMKSKVFVDKLFDGWNEFKEKSQFLKNIKHIVLEITPACDYAEKKSLVNRLLPGIMWPHKYLGQAKSKADFAYVTPLLTDKDGNLFHFVFDFRTFTSTEVRNIKSKRPMFAIQNELLADIQSKLARHVSRLGVVSVN